MTQATTRHKWHKGLALLLAIVMCLSLLPGLSMTALAAGEPLTLDASWVLYESNSDGTDTITITEFNKTAARDTNVTELIIPATIDGKTITRIGGGGVFSSVGLEKVTIQAPLVEIGESAFRSNNLTEMSFPAELVTIGNTAFASNVIAKVDLENTQIVTLGANAFQDNTTRQIIFPTAKTLRTIGGGCFYNCGLNSEVVFPEGITSIGSDAFNGAGAAATFNFEAYAPGAPGISTVGWAFLNAKVKWGDPEGKNASSSNPFIFNYDTGVIVGLKNACATATYVDDYWNASTGELIIPPKLKDPVSEEWVQVTGIRTGAFNSYPAYNRIKKITFHEDAADPNVGTHTMTTFSKYTFSVGDSLTEVNNIPASVTTLLHRCMTGSPNVTKLVFPGVIKAEENLFEGMRGLQEVEFQSDKIQKNGFAAMFSATASNALRTIRLPNMAKDSVNGAPWGATYATTYWKDDGVTPSQVATATDANGLSWEYNAQTGILLKYAGDYADLPEDIVIPAKLGTTDIKQVGTNLTRIFQTTPYPSFSSMTFEPGITGIGRPAFAGVQIETLDLSDTTLKVISMNAFNGCNILNLTLPDSLESLGWATFAGTQRFTSVTIPGNVTSIDPRCFARNGPPTDIIIMMKELARKDDPGFVQGQWKTGDTVYKKAPAAVTTNAPFKSGGKATITYMDSPVPEPDYIITSNALVDPTDNTVSITPRAFTSHNFYVIKGTTEPSGIRFLSVANGGSSDTGFGDITLTNPTSRGRDNAATASPVIAKSNGDYIFGYTIVAAALRDSTNPDSFKDYNGATYLFNVTTVDSFHKVTYDTTELSSYPGAGSITGTATDVGGYATTGYVEGFGVKTHDGSGLNIIQDNTHSWKLVGWKDKDSNTRVALGANITMPNRDMTLVPVLEDVTVTGASIKFYPNGGEIKYLGGAPEEYVESNITPGELLTTAAKYENMTVTREGYRLAGWSTTDGDNAVDIVTYPGGGTTEYSVYAVWEIRDDIVVTFDANGGYFGNVGVLTSKVGPGTYGTALTAPTASRDGYSFDGWYESASPAAGTAPIDPSSMTYPPESTVYYAKWTADAQDVEFDRGSNGKFTNSTEETLTYQIETDKMVGDVVTAENIAITANDGYEFRGWSDGTSLYSAGEVLGVDVPAVGLTFTAQYAQRGAGVIFFDYAGGTDAQQGTSKLLTKPAGSALASSDVPTVARTGYTFSKWVDEQGNEVDTAILKYPAEGATTKLYADWTANGISVQFLQGEHGTLSSDAKNVKAGQPVSTAFTTIPTPTAADGWEFSGLWQSSEDGSIYKTADVSNYVVSGANETVTFTALYNEIGKHTIIYVLGDGTWTDGKNTVTVPGKMGETVAALDTSKITPPTGWTFKNWDSTEPTIFGTAGEVTILNAVYEAGQYTVTFNANNGATPVPTKTQTITYGTPTKLTANSFTKAGSEFKGWDTDRAGTTVVYTDGSQVTDLGDTTLYAVWETKQVTVTFMANDAVHDTKTGDAGTVLTAPSDPQAEAGYTFDGWYDGQTKVAFDGTTAPVFPNADAIYTAKFTPTKQSITFDEGTNGAFTDASATATFTDAVETGEALNTAAGFAVPGITPNAGYNFIGWQSSEGGMYAANEIGGLVMGPDDITFTAQYALRGAGVIYFDYADGAGGYKIASGPAGSTILRSDIPSNVTKAGYELSGWKIGNETVENLSALTFPAEGTVTPVVAQWTAQPITVKFTVDDNEHGYFEDGNDVVYEITSTVNSGTAVGTVPTPQPDSGWSFSGYWTSDEGTFTTAELAQYEISGANNPLTFTAQFTQLGKTAIIYDYAGGKDASDEPSHTYTGVAGTAFREDPSEIEVTLTGYTLTEIDPAEIYPDEGATIIYAHWQANDYEIVFNKNANDATGTMNSLSAVYDTPVNLTAIGFTRPGYTFQGWDADDDGNVDYANGASVLNLCTGEGNDTSKTLKAVWTVNAYSISYDYDGGAVATANPASANAGDTVNLTAPTKTGYSPDATASPWTVKTAGGTTVTVTNNSFTMPDDDVTVSYKFKANEYKVIFHVNEGTGTDEQEQTFTYDANETALKSLEELNITREGYNFLGWSRDSGATSASYADGALVRNLSTGDPVDLYAVWSINEYAISYDYDGGALPAGAASNADKAEYGDSITLTVPEKFGYEFQGWISDDVNIANNSFKMPAKNVAIKADWEALSNTISFTAEEGGKVTTTPASTTRYSGSTVNIEPTAANDPGYSFDGYWLLKETGELLTAAQVKTYEIVGENDTFTFEAQFTLNKNGTIFIDFNGGEAGGKAYYKTSAPGESEIGTAADEIAALFGDSGVKKDGYTITGLKLNDADVDLAAFLQSPPTTYPAAGEMDVYQLQWTADKNTVKFVVPHAAPNGNETEVAVWTGDAGVPTDETLLANNRTLPTVEVAEGYVFKNQWECSEGGTFTLADMAKYVMPAKDVTFTAVVVHSTELASSWKLTFDAGDGAFDGENPLSVENGKTVSLGSYKATAPDGKLFDGWADETGSKITSIVMDADKTVYAVYKDDTSVNGKFTVTFSAGANGKFANEQTEITVEVAKDTAISETIEEPTAEENYTFIGWTTAASGDAIIPTAAIAMIPVTENVTYTASYTKTGPIDEVEYTLIFDTNGSTDSFEAITLPKGEKVDVSVFVPTAPTDKVFDGWTLNNRVVNVVTLDGDKTVIARYSDVVKYDVTFLEEDGTEIEKQQIVSGESVTTVPTAKTIDGKTFLGWTIGRDATVYTDDAVKGMAITRATTFKAAYAEDAAATSTLSFDTTANGGSGTVNDVTQPVGTKISLTGYAATPAEGYDFVGWNLDKDATAVQADYTFTDSDATVYAIYAAKPAPTTHTVKFMNGADELSSQTVNEGECATAPTAPTAPAGQEFAGWKDETGTVYTEAGVNGRGVTADVTYTAYFKNADAPVVTTKTLTFDANGGKDAPAAMTLPTGTKVQLTGLVATPPTGREFNGWKLNGALVTEVTLDDNVIVVADYAVTNPAGPFTVTFSAGSNGKMTPETYTESVVGGNTVSSVPEIKANSSYTFEGWTLNGGGTKYSSADVAAMKITGDSDFVAYYSKTTTIGGGGGGQTIEVPVDDSCKQDETCLLSEYRDLDPKAWYHDGVHFVIENKIMTGTGDKVFEPNAAVTRAQIVTILWRLEGSPVSGRHSFSDVASGSWYDQAVAWAAANGIVNGYDAKTFGPGDDITREQFATIMHRYASFKGYSTSAAANLSSYTDSGSISSWAQAAMRWANAEGLITGTTATTLDPGGNATRAQAACIIQRFCENVAK